MTVPHLANRATVPEASRELRAAGYIVETDATYVYARGNTNGYPHRLLIRGGTVSRRNVKILVNKKRK